MHKKKKKTWGFQHMNMYVFAPLLASPRILPGLASHTSGSEACRKTTQKVHMARNPSILAHSTDWQQEQKKASQVASAFQLADAGFQGNFIAFSHSFRQYVKPTAAMTPVWLRSCFTSWVTDSKKDPWLNRWNLLVTRDSCSHTAYTQTVKPPTHFRPSRCIGARD